MNVRVCSPLDLQKATGRFWEAKPLELSKDDCDLVTSCFRRNISIRPAYLLDSKFLLFVAEFLLSHSLGANKLPSVMFISLELQTRPCTFMLFGLTWPLHTLYGAFLRTGTRFV